MPRKILAIQFKYLGDVVVATPALRALKEHSGGAELHVLVPEEAAPLLAHAPWIDRVWGFPRRRGRMNLRAAWPVVKELRAQRFDVSVDLAGNDRGALLSLLVGARTRIGMRAPNGSLLRRACYTRTVETLDATRHESLRLWAVVAAMGVPYPDDMRMHVTPDPALLPAAKAYLAGVEVLCFINASQPKREWPLSHWAEFHAMASAHGVTIGFTGGHSAREKSLLRELRERIPQALVLEPAEPLQVLIASLAQLKGLITTDSSPMHIAAALGVPTISLFGPNAAQCWAPLGARHAWLQGSPCPCGGQLNTCQARNSCIAAITPRQVHDAFQQLLTSARSKAPG
jgi:ADP-heptose:LPS heptosyltransferase